MERKECQKCKQELSLDNFYFRKDSGKYRAACKKCKSVQTKDEIQKQANAELKTCKHCNEIKNRSEFGLAGGGKWLQPYCKPCDKIRKEIHRQNNIDKYKERGKEYYLENRTLVSAERKEISRIICNEKLVENSKKYIANLPKKTEEEKAATRKQNDRKWKEANQDKIIAYREKNKGKYNEQKKEWQRMQMSKPEFVLLKRLRGRIYMALKRGIKSQPTISLLGCSIEHFKIHIENQLINGMSWENMGKWHLDHKTACIHFDLTKEEEQKKCFHYSNIRPLWAIDNLKKGTKNI